MEKTILRPTFSGHETFQCRHLWLKKGYDFVHSGKAFTDQDAVVHLGVGKNMVASIRYWMRAFDLLDHEDNPTEFAHLLFSDQNGLDPYLEDDASLWLLHYKLVRKGYATTYRLIFNELRRERIEFSKENFVKFVQLKSEAELPYVFNKNTVEADFEVFVKLYMGTDSLRDREDVISGIFPELNLVRMVTRERQSPVYAITDGEQPNLPDEVVLYVLLSEVKVGNSVSLNMLELDYNSVGSIFALNRAGLLSKIESLCGKHSFLVYKDDAGVRELQFKFKPEASKILLDYYEREV